MKCERRKIIFSGRVQGVGFRMTAAQLGRDLPLTGTVQNVDSGEVELIVDGSPHEIDTLVDRLREHFGAFVRSVDQAVIPPTGIASPSGSGIRVIA